GVRRARLGRGRLAAHSPAAGDRGIPGRYPRLVREPVLSRPAGYGGCEAGNEKGEPGGVRACLLLVALGLGLTVVATGLGGRAAGIGGLVALAAQLAAVALLRPAMRAPQPTFMALWLGGMGARALEMGGVLPVG